MEKLVDIKDFDAGVKKKVQIVRTEDWSEEGNRPKKSFILTDENNKLIKTKRQVADASIIKIFSNNVPNQGEDSEVIIDTTVDVFLKNTNGNVYCDVCYKKTGRPFEFSDLYSYCAWERNPAPIGKVIIYFPHKTVSFL